jgi:23S rRNA (pseudouridine1915-N3)-methyltransferase
MLRITLLCVGRLKAGAERDLASRYLDRAKLAGRGIGLAFDLRELDESRARRADDRKTEEARSILTAAGPSGRLMVLDETGWQIGSDAFAGLIATARDDGTSSLALVVGGPDGLDPALREAASASLSFGAMTWPHQLVRIMASEQLYRAVTILSGHPYHRA